MLENQFIQFYDTLAKAKAQPAFPVQLDAQDDSKRVDIFVPKPTGYNPTYIGAYTLDGTLLEMDTISTAASFLSLFTSGGFLTQLDDALDVKESFYLDIELEDTQEHSQHIFSQPFIRVGDDIELSGIKYRCNEDAFGFPFGSYTNKYAYIQLPIRLHSPQNVQEDKTYVKFNGEVVTLFAKYYKEWEGETEYLDEATHDKIVAALSCDEVYIDGKRVTKTDSYQVDWENHTTGCDSNTKLARATFKVRENITQRNSNY